MAVHALVTGPLMGRVDTPDPRFPEDSVDVSSPVLYFQDEAHALIVAEAIERMHVANGTHPTQTECAYLDDKAAHPNGVDPDRVKAHKAAHKALRERMPH